MGVIVVDAAFKAKLLAAGGTAELRDETGAVLAQVVTDPAQQEKADLKKLAEEMEVSEEELVRLLDPNQPTYTTEEVLAHAKERRRRA